MIDARMQAALARLTDSEKECLRRRLQQQTAKEMALELGVSPHAVEKRLKMARAKLGLSSSLEAARLLTAAERYQGTGPQAPDLDPAQEARKSWLTKPKLVGVTAMTVLAAAMLAFLTQGQSGGMIDNPAYDETAGNPGERRSIQDFEFVKASPERVEAYVRQMFDSVDRDGSGFVENAEAPEWLSVPKPGPLAPGEAPEYVELEGEAARAQYIENVDKDGDGKVSYDEYAGPVRPQFLRRGIPLIPADWTGAPASREETAESGLEPALARGNVMPTPIETRYILADSFARLDADGSGYMEGNEGPVSTPQGPQPVFRRDESGKLVDTGERVTKTVEELRANFYQMADQDGDERVSRAEYESWAIGNLRLTGISPEHRQAMNAAIEPQS